MSTNRCKKLKNTLLLALLAALAIGPFIWLLLTALKGSGENIFDLSQGQWWPKQPTLEHFATVWHSQPMGRYILNSIVVSAGAVVANLSTAVLVGFVLAFLPFRGKAMLQNSLVATMAVPAQVTFLPLFLMALQLGLDPSHGPIATWLGLVLPFCVSSFGMLWMAQAMQQLPMSLCESAMLDGCHALQTLWHVVLPMLRPQLATLALFTFIASWDEFLWPSLLLSDPQSFTLPVGLIQLQGAFSANWRLIAAGTLLAMLPILLVFILLQRWFLTGLNAGAVKE